MFSVTRAGFGTLACLFVYASVQCSANPGVHKVVDDHIANNPLCVFVKSYCGYSRRARDLLGELVQPDALHVIEIDKDPEMNTIQDYLERLTGGRTVPRVFIGRKFVGGCDDIRALHEEGKLVAMLEGAGVPLMGAAGGGARIHHHGVPRMHHGVHPHHKPKHGAG